jgi:hypothetical protein
LTAEVKVGVRVPEDAIPSIRNAPGEMISFTYSVEVVIDIHGKLGGANTILPTLSMVDGPSTYGSAPSVGKQEMAETLTAWGLNCIDTSHIRREKNAITCVCDLIVGTLDSGKTDQLKQSQTAQPASQHTASGTAEYQTPFDQQTIYQDEQAWANQNGPYADWEGYGNPQPGGYNDYYDEYGYEEGYDYSYNPSHYDHGYGATNGHGMIAPPRGGSTGKGEAKARRSETSAESTTRRRRTIWSLQRSCCVGTLSFEWRLPRHGAGGRTTSTSSPNGSNFFSSSNLGEYRSDTR